MANYHNKKKYLKKKKKNPRAMPGHEEGHPWQQLRWLEVSSLGLGIRFLGLGINFLSLSSSSLGFGINTFSQEGNLFTFGFWQGISLLTLALVLKRRPPLTSLFATNYLKRRKKDLSGRGLFQGGKGKNSGRRQRS